MNHTFLWREGVDSQVAYHAGAEGKLRSFAGPGHSTAEDGGVLHQVSHLATATAWQSKNMYTKHTTASGPAAVDTS